MLTKKQLLERLETIKDSMDSDFLNRYTIEGVMDTDFLNRHAIEGIVKYIKTLRWDIIDEFDAPGID